MVTTLIQIVHVFVCLVLMFVVLLQQGKGGGMGAAFGGSTAQVFGGRGAGNILTRATAICATIFMLTSVALAFKASEGDRALRQKAAEEEARRKSRGQVRPKEKPPAVPGSGAPSTGEAPTTPGETPAAPAETPAAPADTPAAPAETPAAPAETPAAPAGETPAPPTP